MHFFLFVDNSGFIGLFLFSFVKSLPVLFILGIAGWSYYAYVVALVLGAMQDNLSEQVHQ